MTLPTSYIVLEFGDDGAILSVKGPYNTKAKAEMVKNSQNALANISLFKVFKILTKHFQTVKGLVENLAKAESVLAGLQHNTLQVNLLSHIPVKIEDLNAVIPGTRIKCALSQEIEMQIEDWRGEVYDLCSHV
jgi:hypothetical protein